MGTTTELSKTKPFHESIVEAISRASSRELECLATLIKATKVPRGHDEIIVAWNKQREKMCWGDVDFGVPAALNEQKTDAEEKSKASGEKKSVSLDELQQEVEKLLALLRDRQPELMTWNESMQERLQSLHKLASSALGK